MPKWVSTEASSCLGRGYVNLATAEAAVASVDVVVVIMEGEPANLAQGERRQVPPEIWPKTVREIRGSRDDRSSPPPPQKESLRNPPTTEDRLYKDDDRQATSARPSKSRGHRSRRRRGVLKMLVAQKHLIMVSSTKGCGLRSRTAANLPPADDVIHDV